ncbi:MAG: tryptophan synthase subunit alpha [Planctomycetota bacterium]
MSLATFERALASRERHLSAFLMLGDPTPDLSVRLAVTAVRAGASMLELGIPYSDPCADGPAIEAACLRARAAGTSTREALDLVERIRGELPDTPIHLLVYANLVHAPGYGAFCASAAASGASTLLVPDVPLEESPPLRDACNAAALGHAQLVGPRTTPARLAALDDASTSYLYLAGYQGVTGIEETGADAYRALARRTVERTRRPVCLGFGLSKADDVRAAFEGGARMAVVGSHLARAIEHALGGDVERALHDALSPLAEATTEPVTTPDSRGELRCS